MGKFWLYNYDLKLFDSVYNFFKPFAFLNNEIDYKGKLWVQSYLECLFIRSCTNNSLIYYCYQILCCHSYRNCCCGQLTWTWICICQFYSHPRGHLCILWSGIHTIIFLNQMGKKFFLNICKTFKILQPLTRLSVNYHLILYRS